MSECIFCQKLENVLFESENFVLLCDKYPIIEGTILIVSKKHMKCMAEISEEEFQELNELIEKVRIFFQKCYKKNLTWFEHGVAGQMINHAHIHLLPLSKSLIRNVVVDNGNPYEVEYFEEWNEFFRKKKRYYLFNQFDSFFLFEVERAKKGYFRHLVAKALNREERVDWQNYENKNREKQVERLADNWKKWIVAEKK